MHNIKSKHVKQTDFENKLYVKKWHVVDGSRFNVDNIFLVNLM